MKITSHYDPKALKARGIMQQKQPGLFTIRLRVVGGKLTADQLQTLTDIVGRFNCREIHITSRQGVEIPNVPLKDVEPLSAILEQSELAPPMVGPGVRTITACQGGTCVHGIIDTQLIAQKIATTFGERKGLPHKFKIGITGCPNACMKPRENDFGIMGKIRKSFTEDSCSACSICLRTCPVKGALAIAEGILSFDEKLCNGCGKCIAACPKGAWKLVKAGLAIYVGGKMGKQPRLADELPIEIADEDHLADVLDATIEWYECNGAPKERLGSTIDRLGIEKLISYIKQEKGC